MRWLVFAKRNFKEILRDPLSYIFGIGLPIVMLVIMTVINQNIPAEAEMSIYNIDNLSCGIAVFSLTFTMLCAAMLVSRDRSGAFLQRLYSTPMKPADFVLGYLLPMLAVAAVQIAVTLLSSMLVGAIVGENLHILRVLGGFLCLLPSAVMFICIGIAIGFLLNANAAPPCCSIIITLSGLLGGIWFDASIVGGALETICKILPFLNAVECARGAVLGNVADIWIPLIITAAYTLGFASLALLSFHVRRKRV